MMQFDMYYNDLSPPENLVPRDAVNKVQHYPTTALPNLSINQDVSTLPQQVQKGTNRQSAGEGRIVVGLGLILLSIVGMLGVAMFSIFQNTPQEIVPQLSEEQIEEASESERLKELLWRVSRGPVVDSDSSGPLYQLVLNEAGNKARSIESQRADKNHPGHGKHRSVLATYSQVAWNDLLLQATLGKGMIIEVIDSLGMKRRLAISDDMTAAFALLNLAALEETESREVFYNFDLARILTLVGKNQERVRLARAAELAKQGLLDIADELIAIQQFRQSIKTDPNPGEIEGY